MKFTSIVGLAALLALTAGCGKKSAEITDVQRKEAANLFSEAEFAMTLRDYPRAEPLFERAAKLCPDTGDYWVNLGVARKKQGDTSGAKAAYESALEAYRDAYKADEKRTGALLQQIQALLLLGRVDDAHEALAKARKKLPENRELRMFEEAKEIDRLVNDRGFREIALL